MQSCAWRARAASCGAAVRQLTSQLALGGGSGDGCRKQRLRFFNNAAGACESWVSCGVHSHSAAGFPGPYAGTVYTHTHTHTHTQYKYVRMYVRTYIHTYINTHTHTHPTRALSRARRQSAANVPAFGSAQGLTTVITRAETRPLRPQTHAAVSRARTLRPPLPRPPSSVRFMEAESSMMIFSLARVETLSFTCPRYYSGARTRGSYRLRICSNITAATVLRTLLGKEMAGAVVRRVLAMAACVSHALAFSPAWSQGLPARRSQAALDSRAPSRLALARSRACRDRPQRAMDMLIDGSSLVECVDARVVEVCAPPVSAPTPAGATAQVLESCISCLYTVNVLGARSRRALVAHPPARCAPAAPTDAPRRARQAAVADSSKPKVIAFCARRCGPCKVLGPQVEILKSECPSLIRI